jgi:hypothetical protein
MNRQSILSKTAKGLMEASGKTSDLSRDLRNLLKEIDGKVTVGQLQMRQELFTEAKFMEALKTLEFDGYVREATPQPGDAPPPRSPVSKPPPGSDSGADLDFTAIASRTGAKKAADISQQIAAERERVEAAARAKAEAEERAKKAAYESDEKRKREELDRIHREAEARAKTEAEGKARREAEARAKSEAEARAKEAEERARREAEARAKAAAEEKARREAEERAKREAAERARREAEERERQEQAARLRREEEQRRAEEEEERRREEDDKRRWEIEARAEAAELEAQIRQEREASEEKARRSGASPEAAELEAALRAERAETAERQRRENEERARREEEERRREEEESRLRLAESPDAAEEEIRRREEEMRRREKEEAARAKAEAKARAEADAKAAAQARKEAQVREKTREDEERRAKNLETGRFQAARLGRGRRRRRNIGRPLAGAIFLILVLSLAALHFVPLDSAPYQRTAEDWLGQPVRIGAVYVALVPSPQLRFERVTIGKDPQMRIAAARASVALASILDERRRLRTLQMEGATVPPAFLAALLSGGSGGGIGIERVTGKGVRLDIPGISVPELEVDAALDGRGAVRSIRLSNAERKLTATLQPRAGRASIEIEAAKFTLPIGADLTIEDFSAKGTVGRTELALSEFDGHALNGTVHGNARMRWSDGWTVEGEFSVRQMDAAMIAAPIVASGKLDGKGVYGMKAAAPGKLFEATRMEGRFTVQKGSITNVDMTRVLQGGGTGGGTTLFSEMSGNANADAGRIQVRQLRLAAGLLQGAGNVDVDPRKNLSGRVQIELRAQTVQARATLAVSGSLQNPQFRRSN